MANEKSLVPMSYCSDESVLNALGLFGLYMLLYRLEAFLPHSMMSSSFFPALPLRVWSFHILLPPTAICAFIYYFTLRRKGYSVHPTLLLKIVFSVIATLIPCLCIVEFLRVRCDMILMGFIHSAGIAAGGVKSSDSVSGSRPEDVSSRGSYSTLALITAVLFTDSVLLRALFCEVLKFYKVKGQWQRQQQRREAGFRTMDNHMFIFIVIFMASVFTTVCNVFPARRAAFFQAPGEVNERHIQIQRRFSIDQFARFHWFYNVPLEVFCSIISSCKLMSHADSDFSDVPVSEVLWIPTALHSLPLVITNTLRALSAYQMRRLLAASGVSMVWQLEPIDRETLLTSLNTYMLLAMGSMFTSVVLSGAIAWVSFVRLNRLSLKRCTSPRRHHPASLLASQERQHADAMTVEIYRQHPYNAQSSQQSQSPHPPQPPYTINKSFTTPHHSHSHHTHTPNIVSSEVESSPSPSPSPSPVAHLHAHPHLGPYER